MTNTILYAGKQLTPAEELRTRRLTAFLRRCGDDETAETLERFLPEHDHEWSYEDRVIGDLSNLEFAAE
jgi:hypothetical protein